VLWLKQQCRRQEYIVDALIWEMAVEDIHEEDIDHINDPDANIKDEIVDEKVDPEASMRNVRELYRLEKIPTSYTLGMAAVSGKAAYGEKLTQIVPAMFVFRGSASQRTNRRSLEPCVYVLPIPFCNKLAFMFDQLSPHKKSTSVILVEMDCCDWPRFQKRSGNHTFQLAACEIRRQIRLRGVRKALTKGCGVSAHSSMEAI